MVIASGIRSERRLCEEVHLNLAYRWFCRLGLDGEVPDHSTFSKNRHGRFRESDLLRRLFETVVRRCIGEGLVGGEGFAVDASLIKAEANRQKGVEGNQGSAARADQPGIDEYLAVLDDAAFGAATEVIPKFISPADPAARWTGAHGGQAFFAYSDNYLIDLDHGIIVDVEAFDCGAPGRGNSSQDHDQPLRSTVRPLPRAPGGRQRPMARPRCCSGWCTSAASSPTFRCSTSPGAPMAPSRAATSPSMPATDTYLCPGGKQLTTTGTVVNDGTTLLYRASKHDCQACALKPRCCPKEPARKVPRSIYEGARDLARDIATT